MHTENILYFCLNDYTCVFFFFNFILLVSFCVWVSRAHTIGPIAPKRPFNLVFLTRLNCRMFVGSFFYNGTASHVAFIFCGTLESNTYTKKTKKEKPSKQTKYVDNNNTMGMATMNRTTLDTAHMQPTIWHSYKSAHQFSFLSIQMMFMRCR